MASNLHVRNLEDEVVARLKRRAARNGRSEEQAAKLRAEIGDRPHTLSEVLLRESREER